jgi:hypothetical protein
MTRLRGRSRFGAAKARAPTKSWKQPSRLSLSQSAIFRRDVRKSAAVAPVTAILTGQQWDKPWHDGRN